MTTLNPLSKPLPEPPEAHISIETARKASEYFDSLSNLDPIKQRRFNMTKESYSQSHAPSEDHIYAEIAALTPFSVGTTMGDFTHNAPNGRRIPKLHPPSRTYISNDMPRSQSENNIGYRSGLSGSLNSDVGDRIYLALDTNTLRTSSESATSSSYSRGMSSKRSLSPTKALEDIAENQSMEVPLVGPKKRSRSPFKRLLGEAGKSEKTTNIGAAPTDRDGQSGLRNLGGMIKKGMGNLTESVSKLPQNIQFPLLKNKTYHKSSFQISLSPPLQANLYSELELMICATANQYLLIQAEHNRMSVDSLNKVASNWRAKNRPQVLEFMFDQSTQRELVAMNLTTFRFFGPRAEDHLALHSMMQAWKGLAHEMAVRTFCAPDSVVRKHLRDIYKVLELLGAPLATFLAFQELQIRATNVMAEQQKSANDRRGMIAGVGRQWSPPKSSSLELPRSKTPDFF